MTNTAIAQQRLYNQHITMKTFEKPGEIVAWLGAVQAQDYLGSLWAIGLRLPAATEAIIEQAIADKTIVRTWPMRGTLHFVASADIRWILELLAPNTRTLIRNAASYNHLELEEEDFAKSNAIFVKTLQGGKQLIRAELATALAQARIAAKGLCFLLMLNRAITDGLLCYGVRRGKQQTFTLLDEWLPPTAPLTRDEALARFAKRYFTSHGPATLQDFAWWSSLTLTDARAGLEMVKAELAQEVIDGQTYWLASPLSTPATNQELPTAYLLPAYDEYTVAYKDRSAVLDPVYFQQAGNGLSPTIVLNGQIVGTWKRTIKKDAVDITLHLFNPLNDAEKHALTIAISRYSSFLSMPVNVVTAGYD